MRKEIFIVMMILCVLGFGVSELSYGEQRRIYRKPLRLKLKLSVTVERKDKSLINKP